MLYEVGSIQPSVAFNWLTRTQRALRDILRTRKKKQGRLLPGQCRKEQIT